MECSRHNFVACLLSIVDTKNENNSEINRLPLPLSIQHIYCLKHVSWDSWLPIPYSVTEEYICDDRFNRVTKKESLSG